MRKKKSSSSSSTRRKRARGGAVMTRRSSGRQSMGHLSSSRRSSSRRSMGHLSSSRRSASASMSKKMLSVSKYVTILNKLVQSKAIKKDDPLAGYILVPFVDSYGDRTKYSRASQSGRHVTVVGGAGAGPARAASIADEPEHERMLEEDIAELLRRHGRSLLGVHGPCWWHRINHYERLCFVRKCRAYRFPRTSIPGSSPAAASASASRPPVAALTFPPECVGQVYISPGARFEYTNPPGELARAMGYFAAQYQSYCPLVHKTVPGGLTGVALTRIVSDALGNASRRLPPPTTEQFRVPAHFDSPDTRLTFCEYAAIFFFTRDRNSAFSSYLLLNNTMNYASVKDLAAFEYVQRIRHPFIMLFYFALYKCPRIRDIRRANLTPPGMRHLHRFMVVDADFFQKYRGLPLQSLVTFYCFQSFSFILGLNIGPFTNPVPEDDKFHVILLRIEINDATSARLMSHFSDLIDENEAIVTPCVPYTVVSVQDFQGTDQDGFKHEILAGSGFDYQHPFDARIRGFLVVTIREEKYRESMTGRSQVLRG